MFKEFSKIHEKVPLSDYKKISFGAQGVFSSLSDLFRLEPIELRKRLDILKNNKLNYYTVDKPVGSSDDGKLRDYGLQRLVVDKKIDEDIFYLEIVNYGIGTKNTTCKIFTYYKHPNDIKIVNEMLEVLVSVFNERNEHDDITNRLNEELGKDFKFSVQL